MTRQQLFMGGGVAQERNCNTLHDLTVKKFR